MNTSSVWRSTHHDAFMVLLHLNLSRSPRDSYFSPGSPFFLSQGYRGYMVYILTVFLLMYVCVFCTSTGIFIRHSYCCIPVYIYGICTHLYNDVYSAPSHMYYDIHRESILKYLSEVDYTNFFLLTLYRGQFFYYTWLKQTHLNHDFSETVDMFPKTGLGV